MKTTIIVRENEIWLVRTILGKLVKIVFSKTVTAGEIAPYFNISDDKFKLCGR